MIQEAAFLAYSIPLTLKKAPSKTEQIYSSLPTSFLGACLKGRVSKDDVFLDGKTYYLVILATKEFAAERYSFPDTGNEGIDLGNKAWRYFVSKEGDKEDAEKWLNQAAEKGNVAAIFNKAILIRETQPETMQRLLQEAKEVGYKNAEVCLLENTPFTSRGKELDAYRAFVEKGNLIALLFFSKLSIAKLPAERLCPLDRALLKEQAEPWKDREEPLSYVMLANFFRLEEGGGEESLKYYAKANEFDLVADPTIIPSLERELENERQEEIERVKAKIKNACEERLYVDLVGGGGLTSSSHFYEIGFPGPKILRVLA